MMADVLLVLTGEGPTDIGTQDQDVFSPGPMAHIVNCFFQERWKRSWLENSPQGSIATLFVHKSELKKERQTKGRANRLRSGKRPQGTSLHFKAAEIFGFIAMDLARQKQKNVIAVFFRDSDGTRSADRTDWQDKFQSIKDGLKYSGLQTGVPMVPRPKSEAWLLCALKDSAYQNCESLEMRSGNDNSPKNLKDELRDRINETNKDSLNQLIIERRIDPSKIQMPSFQAFREELIQAFEVCDGHQSK